MLSVIAAITIAVAVVALFQYVALPFIRLELRRREARRHIPQPEEVWISGNALLYIDAVGPNGVSIMAIDQDSHEVTRWTDSWPDWRRRLDVGVVWFTGQRRPLGSA